MKLATTACQTCGEPILVIASRCRHCDAPVRQHPMLACPACQVPVAPGFDRCPYCRAVMEGAKMLATSRADDVRRTALRSTAPPHDPLGERLVQRLADGLSLDDPLRAWLVQRLAGPLGLVAALMVVGLLTELQSRRATSMDLTIAMVVVPAAAALGGMAIVLWRRPSPWLTAPIGLMAWGAWLVVTAVAITRAVRDGAELVVASLRFASAAVVLVAALASTTDLTPRRVRHWPWLAAVAWLVPWVVQWTEQRTGWRLPSERGQRWFEVSQWHPTSVHLFACTCAALIAAFWAIDRDERHRRWLGRVCLALMAVATIVYAGAMHWPPRALLVSAAGWALALLWLLGPDERWRSWVGGAALAALVAADPRNGERNLAVAALVGGVAALAIGLVPFVGPSAPAPDADAAAERDTPDGTPWQEPHAP